MERKSHTGVRNCGRGSLRRKFKKWGRTTRGMTEGHRSLRAHFKDLTRRGVWEKKNAERDVSKRRKTMRLEGALKD